MIDHAEKINKIHNKVTFYAILFFLISPIVYMIVALYAVTVTPHPAANDLLIYILLIIAVVEPSLYPIIERFQIYQFKKLSTSSMDVFNLYFTSSIIKFAMVNAVFIYALATFFVTGTTDHIWKFYIIGAFWVIIFWPRKTSIESFLNKAGYDGIQRQG